MEMTAPSVRIHSAILRIPELRGGFSRCVDNVGLFITESLHGVEFRRAARRVKSGSERDQHREKNCGPYEPVRSRPNGFGRKLVPPQINARAEVDGGSDPAA